jgi:hypothetical protein
MLIIPIRFLPLCTSKRAKSFISQQQRKIPNDQKQLLGELGTAAIK